MTANQAEKSILITGASTGIGRASAITLLEAGFQVFACVRNQRAAGALRASLPAAVADRLSTLELDVTSPEQIRAAVTAVEQAVGDRGLWGLFNNAGIAVNGPLECVPIDALRRQLEINVIGQVAVTQAFLPLLCKARGRILTTGSIAGFSGTAAGLGAVILTFWTGWVVDHFSWTSIAQRTLKMYEELLHEQGRAFTVG